MQKLWNMGIRYGFDHKHDRYGFDHKQGLTLICLFIISSINGKWTFCYKLVLNYKKDE